MRHIFVSFEISFCYRTKSVYHIWVFGVITLGVEYNQCNKSRNFQKVLNIMIHVIRVALTFFSKWSLFPFPQWPASLDINNREIMDMLFCHLRFYLVISIQFITFGVISLDVVCNVKSNVINLNFS